MKISVVIPSYNRGALAERAVQSALRQSEPPGEIILVDDASTDDTAERMARFQGHDGFVYHRLERNSGGGVARNAGAARATGDFLAFLDSDDVWLPDHLRTLTSAAQGRSGSFVVASSSMIEGKPKVLPGRPFPIKGGVQEKLGFIISAPLAFQTSTLLMPRATFMQFRFGEDLRRYQDWDLIFRIILAGVPLVLLPHPSVVYTQNLANRVSHVTSPVPALRFLARHGRAMDSRSRLRFAVLHIYRHKALLIPYLSRLLLTCVVGSLTTKELVYYLFKAARKCLAAQPRRNAGCNPGKTS